MKILKNYLFNSSYQLLTMLLPFITIPYISRVLGADGVGLNAFTQAAVGYFVILATLGTAQYGSREIAYYQNDKQARSREFWGITFLSWITSGITIVAFLVFLVCIKQYQILYLIQGIAILATMFDVSWYFSGMEKFKITVTRNFIIKIFSVILIFIFVRHPSDLILYILILTGGTLLGNLSLWPYLKKEVFHPEFHSLNLKKHLRGTISLFLPAITLSIYTLLGKNLIGIFDSIAYAGFYAQASNLITMSLSLVISFATVTQPRMSNMKANGDVGGIKKATIRDFNIVFGICGLIFFGLNAVALKFAPFFWGNSFSMVGKLIMIDSPVIFLIAINYIFMSHYFLPMNRMKSYTVSIFIGVLVNVLLSFCLIPIFGVVAATMITVLTELIFTLCQYHYMQKEFHLKGLFNGLWKYFVSGLLMFAIVFWMNQTFTMGIAQLVLQVLVATCIYFGLNILLKTQLWMMAKGLIKQFRDKGKLHE